MNVFYLYDDEKKHETQQQIAAEVGGALSQCNRVVMVSQGDGEVGAAKLANEVIEIMNKINASAQSLTGRTASIIVSIP